MTTTHMPAIPHDRGRFARIMTALTLSHLTVNIVRRFAYPFLPAISRILGVPLVDVQNVVALQAGVGVFSPIFGGWLEAYSRKRVLMMTLVAMAFISLWGVFLTGFAVFAIVMLLLGAGKIIFQPTQMAYLGDTIRYQRRGLAVGITELSWPLSMLASAPVVGFLLGGQNGLQLVFALLSLSFVLGVLLVWRWLPPDTAPSDAAPSDTAPTGIGAIIPVLRRQPRAFGALLYPFFLVIANEIFYINYGTFMEISFGLLLTALGTVSIVIALAEMSGSFSIIALADRVGKRRFTLFGASGAAVMYVLLPLAVDSLVLAMVGIFVMFFFTEIAIVASLALYTEIVPHARNVFMSANTASHSIGRLVGAILGAQAFAWLGDFQAMGWVAAGIGALAVVCLWVFVDAD